jgi:hypothetical protein
LRWAHYTGACQKPLICRGVHEDTKPLCEISTSYWWQLWDEFQHEFNLSRSAVCPSGVYEPLKLAQFEQVKPMMYALQQIYID